MFKNFFRKRTWKSDEAEIVLEKIRSEFAFLVYDLGLACVSGEKRDDRRARAVVIYKNDHVQIECAGSRNFFHAEIRRIRDGKPAEYNERGYSVGMEEFAKLESDYNYDHLQYFAAGQVGLDGVMRNVAALLKRNAVYLMTPQWIDIEKLNALEDAHFLSKFGRVPNRNAKSPVDKFEDAAADFLLQHGFKKTEDSRTLSPYDSGRTIMHAVWSNSRDTIKLTQADWRDDYTHWILSCNGKFVADTNLGSVPDPEAAIRSLASALNAVQVQRLN